MERSMKVAKNDCIADYAKKIKACGHPVRLKILSLIKNESISVNDFCDSLNQPQPVISQHLAVLKDCDIVISEVQKNKRIYTIADQFSRDLISLVTDKFGKAAS